MATKIGRMATDILWEAPNHKVILRFDHVVLQGHMTFKNHYISATRAYMVKN